MEGIDPGMKKSVIYLSLCAAIAPLLIESFLLGLAGHVLAGRLLKVPKYLPACKT